MYVSIMQQHRVVLYLTQSIILIEKNIAEYMDNCLMNISSVGNIWNKEMLLFSFVKHVQRILQTEQRMIISMIYNILKVAIDTSLKHADNAINYQN